MTSSEPPRFSDRWLRFDAQRPTRSRLLKRFIVAVVMMLIISAMLAIWTG